VTEYSILLPLMPTGIDDVIPFAEIVASGTAARLWVGQLMTLDSFQIFSYLAGKGIEISGGTGVTLMPLRDPYEAALQVRTVALTTGATFVAGFAPGSPELQEAIMGQRYASPLTAAKEYIQAVRAFLRGGTRPPGRYFRALIQQPAGVPEGVPEGVDVSVELALGVLRPRMAYVAGEVGDVAITWLTPPEYIASTLVPALHRGSENAGRRSPRVAAVVHVAVDIDRMTAVDIAALSSAGHLRSDHYTTMLNAAGVPVDRSAPRQGAEALVAYHVFVHGTLDDVAVQLARYAEAGVDEIIINMAGKNMIQPNGRTVRDLRILLEALNELPNSRTREVRT
jgi:5,10-methylenetetrahydromethanopterin reductase